MRCPSCGQSESVVEKMPEARDRRAFYCGGCNVKFDVRVRTMYFECDRCFTKLYSSGNIIQAAKDAGWDFALGDNMHFLCPGCAKQGAKK